jgi:hypothetical protein
MKLLAFELLPPDHVRTRIEVVLGFFVTLAMILLGAVWPSYFTLVSLLILPAPVLFIGAMVKRELLLRRAIRVYLRGSVCASVICWAYYVYFLLTMTRPAG